jgi:hypothetical protein
MTSQAIPRGHHPGPRKGEAMILQDVEPEEVPSACPGSPSY